MLSITAYRDVIQPIKKKHSFKLFSYDQLRNRAIQPKPFKMFEFRWSAIGPNSSNRFYFYYCFFVLRFIQQKKYRDRGMDFRNDIIIYCLCRRRSERNKLKRIAMRCDISISMRTNWRGDRWHWVRFRKLNRQIIAQCASAWKTIFYWCRMSVLLIASRKNSIRIALSKEWKKFAWNRNLRRHLLVVWARRIDFHQFMSIEIHCAIVVII